jgi:hypothetical protein
LNKGDGMKNFVKVVLTDDVYFMVEEFEMVVQAGQMVTLDMDNNVATKDGVTFQVKPSQFLLPN